ncbi:MAG: hypothetical protein ACT4P0_02915 [Panacagrimonas sp.]
MYSGISIGNIIRPTDTVCSLLPTACRVLHIHDDEVSLIPVFWEEAKTDPPAPFIVSAKELAVEIRQQVSVVGRPGVKTYDRESPTGEAKEKAEKVKAAFKDLLEPEALQRAIRDPRYRAQSLRAISGMSESTARRVLHLYWIYNFDEKVFARYTRTEKTKKLTQNSLVKRGPSNGGPALPVVRAALTAGIRKFYIADGLTSADSWVCTMLKHYPHACEETKLSNGRRWFRVKQQFALKVPTRSQFKYVIELIRATEGIERERANKRRKTPKPRPKKGSARQYVDLVGQVFQSDATKLQVRVVLPWARDEVLKTLTLYTALDVGSTAITGWRLSPNDPSTAEALQLLKQCASDKREQIERIGVEYHPEEWVQGLPANLHADRGEWVSKKAYTIVRAGISIKVGEPYLPEKKGAIEKTHDLIKERILRELIPGAYGRHIERGEEDGFKTAALTMDELEMRIVQILRAINLQPPPVEVIPIGMVGEGLPQVSRIDVWNWRLRNEPGAVRQLDEKQLYESFLMPIKASITGDGILYNTRTYVSPVLHEYGYTAKALRRRGDNKIQVFMDEHLPHIVKFEHPKSKQLVDARCEEKYLEAMNLRYWEAELFRAQRNGLAGDADFSARAIDASQRQQFAGVKKDAKAKTAADLKASGTTTNARKKGRSAATAKAKTVAMLNYEAEQQAKGNVAVTPDVPAAATAPPPPADPFAPRRSTNFTHH